MATPGNQQTFVPYDSTKDCSLGKCSISCPEWCSVYFIPPPPSIFADDNSSSSPTLSPLVIALIGILVSAFLLISYYTIISRYCGVSNSIRRRFRNSGSGDGGPGQSTRLEEWQAFPSDGLDESLISRIVVCKYKKGGGFVDSPDCPVCLSEFRNDESLRLLPNCCHAFHIQCIDTWLQSHSNCPICRASIVPEKFPPPAMMQPSSTARVEAHDSPVVISVDDRDERNRDLVVGVGIGNNTHGSEQETHFQNKSVPVKEESSTVVEISSDNDHGNIQQIRRSLPTDSVKLGKVSIDDVSQTSIDVDLIAVKENGISAGTSSSRRESEESSANNSNNHGVSSITNPVLMKRSSSNEGLSLNKHGRGKNEVLPV